MNIGSNIARLRREMGLTQEQLGALVSVSAQAVSKWENGGMPDTELISAIADALHVTIDTLFGREDVKSADMQELFQAWYTRLPQEKRAYALFELLISSQQNPVTLVWESARKSMDDLINLPLKTCSGQYNMNGEIVPIWIRSQLMDDFGITLSVPAEDCPLYLVLPEPEGGYLQNICEPQRYRKLFSALAMPNSMELLFFLYSRKTQYYSRSALAKACGLGEETLENTLEALSEMKLLFKRSIVETDGELKVYSLNDDPSFVPFLLFARWLIEAPGYIMSWSSREKPLFNMEEKTNGKKADK